MRRTRLAGTGSITKQPLVGYRVFGLVGKTNRNRARQAPGVFVVNAAFGLGRTWIFLISESLQAPKSLTNFTG
jgi:hypothetical protein